MINIKHGAHVALVAVSLVGVPAWAASDPPKSPNVKEVPKQNKQPPSGAVPVYKPPVGRGLPGGRVGGGTRGVEATVGATFALSVLAPNHTGLTLQDQPVLYWYLSQRVTSPLEFALTDDGIKPLIETPLTPPFEPGIHGLRLEDYGVKLVPGKRYRWFVALVVDAERRSRDVLAGGTIERVESIEGLAPAIAQASPSQIPFIYAEAGLWYDAIEAISNLIQASPNNSTLRQQRASLLEQGGLAEIAKYELTARRTD
jgi:uncharacterized protein DUF928